MEFLMPNKSLSHKSKNKGNPYHKCIKCSKRKKSSEECRHICHICIIKYKKYDVCHEWRIPSKENEHICQECIVLYVKCDECHEWRMTSKEYKRICQDCIILCDECHKWRRPSKENQRICQNCIIFCDECHEWKRPTKKIQRICQDCVIFCVECNECLEWRRSSEEAKRILISDLGISKSLIESIDNDEEIYDIVPYVALEILQRQKYITASDIYSFGMIMWELMTGRRLFWDQSHDTDLIINICDGLRPSIVTNAPDGYIGLMQQCWHSEPNLRPSATEIYNNVLKRIISNESK
ncbi:6199_t:CDS:2, partial [Funneliformis geosporum]